LFNYFFKLVLSKHQILALCSPIEVINILNMIGMADILKITIPSLIVFLTAYYLLKKFFDGIITLKEIKRASKKSKQSLPLKLQAYERLALYCERIKISNLSLRLNSSDDNAIAMANAMLISIQMEYEHNLAQQIYVSDKLWQIVNLAKIQTIAIITEAKERCNNYDSSDKLMSECEKLLLEFKKDPMDSAISAIKEEVSVMLN